MALLLIHGENWNSKSNKFRLVYEKKQNRYADKMYSVIFLYLIGGKITEAHQKEKEKNHVQRSNDEI